MKSKVAVWQSNSFYSNTWISNASSLCISLENWIHIMMYKCTYVSCISWEKFSICILYALIDTICAVRIQWLYARYDERYYYPFLEFSHGKFSHAKLCVFSLNYHVWGKFINFAWEISSCNLNFIKFFKQTFISFMV